MTKQSPEFFVYIMTNANNTVLYTGVTSDIRKRVYQHKHGFYKDSFTSKYKIEKLVYYEQASSAEFAIMREKQIKAGSRKRKIELIKKVNPQWQDLGDAEF